MEDRDDWLDVAHDWAEEVTKKLDEAISRAEAAEAERDALRAQAAGAWRSTNEEKPADGQVVFHRQTVVAEYSQSDGYYYVISSAPLIPSEWKPAPKENA